MTISSYRKNPDASAESFFKTLWPNDRAPKKKYSESADMVDAFGKQLKELTRPPSFWMIVLERLKRLFKRSEKADLVGGFTARIEEFMLSHGMPLPTTENPYPLARADFLILPERGAVRIRADSFCDAHGLSRKKYDLSVFWECEVKALDRKGQQEFFLDHPRLWVDTKLSSS